MIKTLLSKQYSIFSLSRVKTHCNIGEDDNSFDDIIRLKMYAAVDYCENYMNASIAPGNYVVESDNYLVPQPFIYYRLYDVNLTISAITVGDYNGNQTVVPATQYRIEKYSNFTQIFFNPNITAYQLKIYYTAGNTSLSSVPYAVQEAIHVMTALLFQGDRQGLLPNNVVQTGLVERLLSPYKNL